jgi:hypothetical protein
MTVIKYLTSPVPLRSGSQWHVVRIFWRELQLNAEFLAAVRGEGETVLFTEEEKKESRKLYARLSEEEGEMEKQVRKEWALSAAQPAVYLTF